MEQLSGQVPRTKRRHSRAPLAELGKLVERETGIRMPPAKTALLECRLQRRMAALGLTSLTAYRDHLHQNSSSELTQLIDAVTTNKTDFYREPAHFEFLAQEALPALTRKHRSDRIQVWCAGCSSGEEPYTLAMALSDYLEGTTDSDFRILGTDISTRVLTHAKRGVYEQDQLAPLPKTWRDRYVAPSKDPKRKLARIRPQLRSRVSFHRLNFMTPDYAVDAKFDIIFFRNVAIYFDSETQLDVVSKLAAHLTRGGYFFMGLSESLRGQVPGLTHVGRSIYVRS